MDQAQSLQGQQLIDLVDRLGEGDDRVGEAAGGEQPRLRPAPLRFGGRSRRPVRRSRRRSRTGSPHGVAADRRLGLARSIRGCELRVRPGRLSEISTPGPITPPRYSPSAETTSKLVQVPKSTTTQAPAEPLVGSDGVDEAVGADLVRVVDADRHPGLQPGPDREEDGVDVALASAARTPSPSGGTTDETMAASRSPSPAARASRPAMRSPARRRSRPARVWKRQCWARSLAVEGAEVGLGVADVHREKHGAIIAGRPS